MVVRFDLIEKRSINYDFSQVSSGSIFLKQDNLVKYHANLTIDILNKTGTGFIENVIIGNYEVVLELYDSSGEVLYSGSDLITILSDHQTDVSILLSKNISSISITGNWTEDIQELSTGILQLKKNGITKYAGNLVLNTSIKAITGVIDNLKPDLYEIYVEIRNSSGMICFTGNQSIIINKGENIIMIIIDVKTGSITVSITGDVSAPQIVSGPNISIDGQDATITWITNEDATSNICYSSIQGFDYQTSTNWVPLGRDLTADTTDHSITIVGLTKGVTYYYVIVASDATGNMFVSDEEQLIIPAAIIKFATAGDGTYIYTSADGGVTWIEHQSSGNRTWRGIASSADGTKLAACDTNFGAGGYIYTSTDGGVTWIEQEGSGKKLWMAITSSFNGTKLAAIADGPYSDIYTSSDSGTTWVGHQISDAWRDITSSADGIKLAAIVWDGYIYTSVDSGTTWTERQNSGIETWHDIACSSDGMLISAVAFNTSNDVHISVDGGVTWILGQTAGMSNLKCITLSTE